VVGVITTEMGMPGRMQFAQAARSAGQPRAAYQNNYA
jgi:hypothetical protein